MAGGDAVNRKVRRSVRQSEYVNTINVRDRVTIDFVWFPGAPLAVQSHIDPKVRKHPKTGVDRSISYSWAPDGKEPLSVVMESGCIAISLSPGSRGTLTAFGTTWEITRVGRGVNMTPVNQMRGVQERLNRLGYHLRRPGDEKTGVDGALGRRTEQAVLQFEVDYVPPGVPPPGATNQLHVRGEWNQNIDATFLGNIGNPAVNPSTNDGAAFQAALRARVGG
jgi:hypothetical protein